MQVPSALPNPNPYPTPHPPHPKTKEKFFILRKSYIFSKESFSYISENETLHFSAQDQKLKRNPPRQSFLYFRK